MRHELKARRIESGLNVQELAEKIGYAYTSIYRWESGKSSPSIAAVKDWVEYFGLELILAEIKND